jgi:hypothetical protein
MGDGVDPVTGRGLSSMAHAQSGSRRASESARHTPGPWYSDAFGNITTHPPRSGLKALLPTTGIIAKVEKNYEANAHLIAAAPMLLEELQKVPCPRADFAGDTCDFWAHNYAQERCMRCAAIALAEGRTVEVAK